MQSYFLFIIYASFFAIIFYDFFAFLSFELP